MNNFFRVAAPQINPLSVIFARPEVLRANIFVDTRQINEIPALTAQLRVSERHIVHAITRRPRRHRLDPAQKNPTGYPDQPTFCIRPIRLIRLIPRQDASLHARRRRCGAAPDSSPQRKLWVSIGPNNSSSGRSERSPAQATGFG